MKHYFKEILLGFCTGAIIAILAIIVLPKVVDHYSGKPVEPEITVEKEESVQQNTVEKEPVKTTITKTDRIRRETCLFSGCYRERNEVSRYCDEHDNGYRPRRKTSDVDTEQTRDVDDLDVEGFYLENRDEFEDEDDAWDYLEDNEDEWDDY